MLRSAVCSGRPKKKSRAFARSIWRSTDRGGTANTQTTRIICVLPPKYPAAVILFCGGGRFSWGAAIGSFMERVCLFFDRDRSRSIDAAAVIHPLYISHFLVEIESLQMRLVPTYIPSTFQSTIANLPVVSRR